MSGGDDVRTDEENETELIGSKALRGAIVGSWLGLAIAVAVCAATFRPWYPGYSSLAATALVLIVSVLLVARRAAKREGAWGVVLAAVAGAGALPSFISVSLYGATRPLMMCQGIAGVDCFPAYETMVYLGAATTIIPLVLSSIAAALIAKRRRRPIARVIPVLAAVGLLIATIVAIVAGSRGLQLVSADRYLDTVPELGQLKGATFLVVRHDRFDNRASIDATPTSGSSPALKAKWTYEPSGLRCELAIGGGSYQLAATEIRTTPGDNSEEIVCPAVRVRRDASRDLLVVDEILPNGDFRPAFSVRPEGPNGAESGPLYPDRYDLPRVAPARAWVIAAVAGVLAALGLVFVRIRSERALVARWRAAPIGTHRGDGWIAFEDGGARPPIHLPSANDLPAGEVRVLGTGERAKGGYRSSTAASSSEAVAGVLASIERDSRERSAATIVLASLVAFIAATPVASALFVMGL